MLGGLSVGYGVLWYVRFHNKQLPPDERMRLDLSKPLDYKEAIRELQEMGRRGRGNDGSSELPKKGVQSSAQPPAEGSGGQARKT